MKLKKATKTGICDAMRCKAPATETRDGHALCERHAEIYDREGVAEAPATAIVPAGISEYADDVAAAAAVAAQYMTVVEAAKIESQDQLDAAGALAAAVAGQIKALEAKRKEVTDPLVKEKREIDDAFRGPRQVFERVRDVLKQAMLAYKARQDAARLAALDTGDHGTAMAAAPAAMPAGVSTRKRVDFEVVGPVPPEYMCVDMAKIAAAVQVNGLNTKIQGVRVFESETLAVRAAK